MESLEVSLDRRKRGSDVRLKFLLSLVLLSVPTFAQDSMGHYAGTWNGVACLQSKSPMLGFLPMFIRMTIEPDGRATFEMRSGDVNPAATAKVGPSKGLSVEFAVINKDRVKFNLAFDGDNTKKLIGTQTIFYPDGDTLSAAATFYPSRESLDDFTKDHDKFCD